MNILSKASALVLLSLALGGPAWSKLPPPTDEQKAAAEAKKEKDAEAAKKAAELLGKAQDRVAERYIKDMKAQGKEVKPTPIAPPPAAAAPAAPAPAPATQTAAAKPAEPAKKK